jgi:hypothetical protein
MLGRNVVVLLILLVIGSSLGTWFFHENQVAAQATSRAAYARLSATQTAISQYATYQAGEATAEATYQAEATATAQVQVQAQAAAAAPLNPDPSFHTLALADGLAFNSGNWDDTDSSTSLYGACRFAHDGYHVISTTEGYFSICSLENSSFADFVYLVQMKILTGDCGGLVFHSDGYGLYYASVCQNGDYEIARQDGDTDNLLSRDSILLSGYSGAITQGLNKMNSVAVSVRGSTNTLYANKELVADHEQILMYVEEVAQIIFLMALADTMPERLNQLPSPLWLNAWGVDLDPKRWQADKLFFPTSRPRPLKIAEFSTLFGMANLPELLNDPSIAIR